VHGTQELNTRCVRGDLRCHLQVFLHPAKTFRWSTSDLSLYGPVADVHKELGLPGMTQVHVCLEHALVNGLNLETGEQWLFVPRPHVYISTTDLRLYLKRVLTTQYLLQVVLILSVDERSHERVGVNGQREGLLKRRALRLPFSAASRGAQCETTVSNSLDFLM
jgi:hypothetical protein